MHIIVCVKQVPNTAEVKLDPVTGTLQREGVPSIVNPDDAAGIEAALTLKAMYGVRNGTAAKITVVSMGPPQADAALREALAMGCDDAVLLTDRVFGGADTWATSLTLAEYIKTLDFDVIITGRQAIDGDTAQVGPQIAEHLGIPQVTYAQSIKPDFDNRVLAVKRMFEDGYHLVEVKMPCLITALSTMNKPRYMTVAGVYGAYSKDVGIIRYQDLAGSLTADELGLKGSPTRVVKSFNKQPRGKADMYEVSADEAVGIIIRKLKERHII